MSTTARKARKRAHISFSKPAKVGTPFTERAWYAAVIPQRIGDKLTGRMVLRSAKKRARALAARTVAA